MLSMRLFLASLMLVTAYGCTAVKVRPVKDSLMAKMQHVCIEDGQQMCFDGDIINVIRDNFERHDISTKIYTNDMPAECEFHLSYMCNMTWDLATYMHHAELRLYHRQNQVGYGEYHLNGTGGFSVMKWNSTKSKMDPVIDELLAGSNSSAK